MICSTCKGEFPDDQFNWLSRPQNKRKSFCRVCDRACRARCYRKHRTRQIQEVQLRSKKRLQQLSEWKATVGCQVCKETDPCCLDFHHLNPSDKEFSISEALAKRSMASILDEIKKCVLVCKNCHAKIHNGGSEQFKAVLVLIGENVALPTLTTRVRVPHTAPIS